MSAPRENQRAYYRVVYPARHRPAATVGGAVTPVLDCSERGVRLRTPPGEPPVVGDALALTVRFRGGSEVAVRGTVVRASGGELAVRLEAPGIPMGALIAEQRALRARYPAGWDESQ